MGRVRADKRGERVGAAGRDGGGAARDVDLAGDERGSDGPEGRGLGSGGGPQDAVALQAEVGVAAALRGGGGALGRRSSRRRRRRHGLAVAEEGRELHLEVDERAPPVGRVPLDRRRRPQHAVRERVVPDRAPLEQDDGRGVRRVAQRADLERDVAARVGQRVPGVLAVGGPQHEQVVAPGPEEQVARARLVDGGEQGRERRVVALVLDKGGDLEVPALDEAVLLEELGQVAAGVLLIGVGWVRWVGGWVGRGIGEKGKGGGGVGLKERGRRVRERRRKKEPKGDRKKNASERANGAEEGKERSQSRPK